MVVWESNSRERGRMQVFNNFLWRFFFGLCAIAGRKPFGYREGQQPCFCHGQQRCFHAGRLVFGPPNGILSSRPVCDSDLLRRGRAEGRRWRLRADLLTFPFPSSRASQLSCPHYTPRAHLGVCQHCCSSPAPEFSRETPKDAFSTRLELLEKDLTEQNTSFAVSTGAASS